MSAITEAVEAVNQQARQFKAVQLLAEVVRQIGDLDNRLIKLQLQVADKTAERDKLLQELADRRAENAALLVERKQAGVAALEQARVDADAIVNRAKVVAEECVKAALAEVAHADELLKAKGSELKKLDTDIDIANVQLGEVNAKLASAQEAVRKMLGGE